MQDYFQKFSEIENSYRKEFVSKIVSGDNADKCDWIVLEKVDGSNFSFICDGINIYHAKRTSIINDPKSFFDYSNVAQKYNDNVRNVFSAFKEKYSNLVCVNVFGELYGGYYPNSQNKCKPINKNVYYSPDIQFIAFDIYIQLSVCEFWSDYDEYTSILEHTQIPYLKPLFRGTFDEALAYPNQFITTIPKQHGLEDVDNNFAEGVVIKPSINMHFTNGSRIILKNKIEKFSERRTTVTTVPTDKFDVVKEYITENRLYNVISKIGLVTDKDFGKVMKEFCNDITKDYQKDVQLTEKDIKQVNKIVSKEAQSLVRTFLKK